MTRPLAPIAPIARLAAAFLAGAALLAGAVGPVAANDRVGKFGPPTDGALPFAVTFTEVKAPLGTPPALHSFEIAVRPDGTWLMLGGRGGAAADVTADKVPQSGMHGFNPPVPGAPNNFPKGSYNPAMWVYHPLTGESLRYDLDKLPPEIANPLRTTSQQAWYDRATDELVTVGGYGWNADGSDMITYDTMLRVRVGPLIDAIRRGDEPATVAALFSVLRHPGLKVTGGDLAKVGDDFFLVFGHDFNGSYFAFGTSLPSGTTQEYTDEIRQITMVPGRFDILSVEPFQHDTQGEYHRRDLNVRMTRDARTGAPRLGAYGGVFKGGGPGGWSRPILIDAPSRAAVVEDGRQIFNSYATATIPVWAEKAGIMAQVFFGGIGRGVYHTHPEPVGLDDDGMPFGMDVSVLAHRADGSWAEFVLPEPVPDRQLLAANGVFVPHPALRPAGRIADDDVILLDTLPEGEDTLVGWIYGGILSFSPQPPKDPSKGKEAPTRASEKLFEVRLRRGPGTAVPVLP